MITNWTQDQSLSLLDELPEISPGIHGRAYDMPKGIYIPLIEADTTADLGTFLDDLPNDRRVVFPCVENARLARMLENRGFRFGIEFHAHDMHVVEVMQRCPRVTLGTPAENIASALRVINGDAS